MSKRFILVLSLFLFSLSALAAERSIIVLDASGSMWGQIDGRSKIEIAREALADVLRSVPAEDALGLIVYGHRRKGDCGDIELAVPPAVGASERIVAFADTISPKGKTPLSDAVRQASEALRFNEDKATVILVTDGLETCDADPCALGRDLESQGVDFTVHVIGFGLSDDEGRQVSCLAEETGGRYIQAGDAGTLGEALRETVAEVRPPESAPGSVVSAPAFDLRVEAYMADAVPLPPDLKVRWDLYPLDAEGRPGKKALKVDYAQVFEAELPPARYQLKARLGALIRELPVEVVEGRTTERPLVLNAAHLRVLPKRTGSDPEPDPKARVEVRFDGGRDAGYGASDFYVAAGRIGLKARIGKARVAETFMVAAGETLEKTVLIGSGVVSLTAVYAEGGPSVDSTRIRFSVEEVAAGIDGRRKAVEKRSGSGDLNLPVGEYVVSANLGKVEVTSEPFQIVAGQRSEVKVVLNAGVLEVRAAGAKQIEITSATTDIEGRYKRITKLSSERLQNTLPPGDYRVLVTFKEDRADEERQVTVTAGERAEIAIE